MKQFFFFVLENDFLFLSGYERECFALISMGIAGKLHPAYISING